MEPMECRSAESEIEASFVQNYLIEGRDRDLQCGVGIRLPQVRRRSRVRFDGDQRLCAQIKETAGGFAGPGTDLEDGGSVCQATAFNQCCEDPVRIRWPRVVIIRRIGSEGAAAECAINAERRVKAHAA